MLIALGGLALIAALSAALLSLTTAPATRAAAAVERAKAERIAEAALHRLAAAMANERERRLAPLDGAVLETKFMGAAIVVSGQDAAGLIDLNAAPEPVLMRLLAALGIPEPAATAALWAGARPFGSPEAALAALPEDRRAGAAPALPHLTVWSERPTVDPWRATAPALAAAANTTLEEARAFVAARALEGRAAALPPGADLAALAVSEASTARVAVRATTPAGGRASLTAVIRVSDSPREPVRFLSWR